MTATTTIPTPLTPTLAIEAPAAPDTIPAADDTPPDHPTRPPMVTALRITPHGDLEPIDLEQHPDRVAALVGRNPYDATPRVTIQIAGGPVSFWTAESATRQGRPINHLATDLAAGLLPDIEHGGRLFACRNRAALEREPLRGVVIVTGYDRDARILCGVSDVSADILREHAARRARRLSGAPTPAPDAPTQPLVVPGEVTHVIDRTDDPFPPRAINPPPRKGRGARPAGKARRGSVNARV